MSGLIKKIKSKLQKEDEFGLTKKERKTLKAMWGVYPYQTLEQQRQAYKLKFLRRRIKRSLCRIIKPDFLSTISIQDKKIFSFEAYPENSFWFKIKHGPDEFWALDDEYETRLLWGDEHA